MADTNEDHVTEIGRKEDVIRRVLLIVGSKRSAGSMLRDVSKLFFGTVPKFDMAGAENLFGGWGNDGNVQEVIPAVLCIDQRMGRVVIQIGEGCGYGRVCGTTDGICMRDGLEVLGSQKRHRLFFLSEY